MKHNQHTPQLVHIRFSLTNSKATKVCVAGTFNNWDEHSKPLHSSGEGNWWKVSALKPGQYEYCFVVDGKWQTDPKASETVPNPFGGQNSILTVYDSTQTAHLIQAATQPLKALE
jgi:1,4-alpha-glucan branching enzyme